MKYTQPVGAAEDAPYIDGNPLIGQEGSPVPAAAIEAPQREIVKVIEEAGLEPDPDDTTQLWQALQALTASAGIPVALVTNDRAITSDDNGKLLWCLVTGAKTLTLPASAGIEDNFHVYIRNADASSAAVTVARSGADLIDMVGTSMTLPAGGDGHLAKSDKGGHAVWWTVSRPDEAPDAQTPPDIPVVIVTNDRAVTSADHGKLLFCVVSADKTLTLPAASDVDNGFQVYIRNADTSTGTVTLAAAGAALIDQDDGADLLAPGVAEHLVKDDKGANKIWWTANRSLPPDGNAAAGLNVTVDGDNYTVTADDYGEALYFQLTGVKTVTLPEAQTMPAGMHVYIRNAEDSTAELLIAVSGDDVIDGALTGEVLAPGGWVHLVRDTGSGEVWWSVSLLQEPPDPLAGSRAYVCFNASGTVLEGRNVTSVTKNATGDFTVNLAITMSGTRYPVVGLIGDGAVGGQAGVLMKHSTSNPVMTATSFTVLCKDFNDASNDPVYAAFAVFGELA
jgi:hypothetical protein